MDSLKTSQSLDIACADYKIEVERKMEKSKHQIIKNKRDLSLKRTLLTFFLLLHDDDVTSLHMRETFSPKYN